MTAAHKVGVTFPFVSKALMNLEPCRFWIKACATPHVQLNGDKIGHPNYVCSKIRTLFHNFLYLFSVHFYNKITNCFRVV